MAGRRRPVATFSEEGTENIEDRKRQERTIPAGTATIEFPSSEFPAVVAILEDLDDRLRAEGVTAQITPPDGVVAVFYGYERDIWS